MKDNRLGSLLGFTGVSTVLVSTAICSVVVSGFRFAYDNNKHALYIELQDGRRFYFNEIWKFIKAVLFEQRAKNNSGGQSSVGNEIREGQISVGDDVLKNVKSVKNTQNSTVGDEFKEKQVPVGNDSVKNAEKVVNPVIEEERKKLKEDIAFLEEQKDSENYKKYGKNSHKGETDLIKEFHFDVIYVLARRVTWLRHKDISKRMDDFNRELWNKFGIGDSRKLYNNLSSTLNDRIREFSKEDQRKYKNKFMVTIANKSKNFSVFKELFGKEEKEFEIFKQKCEFYCSDEYEEIRSLWAEDRIYIGLDKGEDYGTCCYDVSEFSEEEVKKALEKFQEYKKKYLDLVNENSKKSEFYVKYVPEFFKLSDESAPDEILDCYIDWWRGYSYFEHFVGVSKCPNKEKRLKESGLIGHMFKWRHEKCLDIMHNTVVKAKKDADFSKEYAEKERILNERVEALNLKEKQYEKEGLVVAPIQGSSENVG